VYNAVEKLRSDEPLSDDERAIHELAACGVLRDLHDELDRLVAEAYGWSWPLERDEILARLVTLHDERVAEEQEGLIRWIRPDYQVPRFAPEDAAEQTRAFPDASVECATAAGDTVQWPETASEQIAAVKAAVVEAPGTAEEIARRFKGARRPLVERHLETLKILAEVRRTSDGRYHAATELVEA
jgi:hypothetical protein